MNNPQDDLKCIHIAGTNGKGSVAAYVSSILGCAGFRVGLTVSPHFTSVTERFVIDGAAISAIFLDSALGIVFEASQSINVSLSYFEATICAAFIIFRSANVDYCVLEVGLGGTWDATNIITRPICSVITGIDLDHEETLGRSFSEIAFQKAGIIKTCCPVVTGEMPATARETIIGVAKTQNAKLEIYGDDFWLEDNVYRSKENSKVALEPSLPGVHQLKNSAVAAAVACKLGIDERHIQSGLRNVYWPGRLEEIDYNQRKVIFDAGHNLQATEIIAQYLMSRDHLSVTLVFGALRTKRWLEMINALKSHVTEWFLLEPQSSEKVSSTEIQEYLSSIQISSTILKVPQEVKEIVNQCQPKSTILVCGSIYMMGGVREVLRFQKN